MLALCSSTNQEGKSTHCLLDTTHLQTAMEGRKQERKVKNTQAKALDTLNFPVLGMTTEMSRASSVVMQASA